MTSALPHDLHSRRRVLARLGAAGALAAAGAAGCAAPASMTSSRTRLRFWNFFAGGDGVNMTALAEAFGKQHPAVTLEATQLPWGAPYYTKLGMAGAGGRAPEAASLHLSRLPGFAPGRLLDPFDIDLLAEAGVTPQDFPADIWRRGSIEGKQYAIPLDTHPVVLYYQTQICAKAGLLDRDGILRQLRGTGEFLEALRAIRRVTGKPALVTETLGPDVVGPWRMFSTLYSQTGGTILDPQSRRPTLDEAKTLRVLDFMRTLTHEGLAVRRVDYNGGVATFNAGDTGLFLNGEWEVQTFQQGGLPFSMARVPALFGGRATVQADSHSFVLPHQRDRGGAGNHAAHTFVAWMLKQSPKWAEGGHVPAYAPTLGTSAYRELKPQSAYRSVIDDVVLDPQIWFAGSASTMWLELGAVLSGVFTGSRTPLNALHEMQARLTKLLDTPDPLHSRGGHG